MVKLEHGDADADPGPGLHTYRARAMRERTVVFLKLFAPCEALMRRLKLGQKFALIAVVLLAPLAFVTYSYVSTQGKQEAFSTKERAGLTAIRPLVTLLGAAAEARSGAAHSNPAAASGVQAAADGVDPVLAKLRGELDLSRSWPALKRKIAAATAMTPATGPRAVAAWDGVSTDAVALIAEASDRSNLTLDPDLDTYYLQDTINVKIPTLLDAGGRAADLAAVDAKAHHDEIVIANGTVARHGRGHHYERPEGRQEHEGLSPRAVFGRAAGSAHRGYREADRSTDQGERHRPGTRAGHRHGQPPGRPHPEPRARCPP